MDIPDELAGYEAKHQAEARLEAERQNARVRDSVHALFLIAQYGTMYELRRAMAIAFLPPPSRAK